MSEKRGERMGGRLREMFGLCESLLELLCCVVLGETLDLHFIQASSMIQFSLKLLQLPSPVEGLVFKRANL